MGGAHHPDHAGPRLAGNLGSQVHGRISGAVAQAVIGIKDSGREPCVPYLQGGTRVDPTRLEDFGVMRSQAHAVAVDAEP